MPKIVFAKAFTNKPPQKEEKITPDDSRDEKKGLDEKNGKDKDGKDKKRQQALKFEVQEHDSGHKVRLHPKVEVDLPHDADFQHHATQRAIHAAGYLSQRKTDPELAEAHRQAANIHARLANAMHNSGNVFRGGSDSVEDAPLEDPEDGPFAVLRGGAPASPGNDIEGRPLPGKPDAMRNQPGADSAMDVRRRQAGPQVSSGDPKKRQPFGKALPIVFPIV
jgi:hypothetical protein